MKGKVLILILVVTAFIMAVAYYGYLDPKNLVQINANLEKFNCDDSHVDLRVTAVDDSAANFLIGRTISPEATFAQSKLNKTIDGFVKHMGEQAKQEFVLVGFVKKSKTIHCSGSECFVVKKIKLKGANEFTEF